MKKKNLDFTIFNQEVMKKKKEVTKRVYMIFFYWWTYQSPLTKSKYLLISDITW